MVDDREISALADASSIAGYEWLDQGEAPPAYLRGMAVAFACAHGLLLSLDGDARYPDTALGTATSDVVAWTTGQLAIAEATADIISDSSTDVLAWYAPQLDEAQVVLDTPADKLIALFAIMLGLGMRESSGAHCVGADTPKNRGEETTEANAEAGLFQVSYDSIDGNALRQSLFNIFRHRSDLLLVFSEEVTCADKDIANFGTGEGAAFQEAMKSCPLFACLYTAAYLRVGRSQWGPINHHAAELKPDAVTLFQDVRALVDAAP
ncbi:MAG: hypothetical protein JWR80_6027 [Bradyrhizobium sp.]|nr:hypothetical protein [Bradyrhizobium sp.]